MTNAVLSRGCVLVLCAAVYACGGQARPAEGPAPAPRPAQAVAPMDLGGQKVLVLPVQIAAGVGEPRDEVTREVLFALGERDSRSEWIGPDRLRSALQRAPGYAPDPGVLPSDAYRHHQQRYVIEPL